MFHPQMSKESAIPRVECASWRLVSRIGVAEGKACGGGASDVGSRTYTAVNPAQAFGAKFGQGKDKPPVRKTPAGVASEILDAFQPAPGKGA